MDTSGRQSLVGTALSHYQINSSIGAGGMGEVYRATDMNLGRDVALKVLPAAMAGDADRLARFQREARVVAALNHPNVVTIYSVEQAENVQFITMELIEGQSLDRLILGARLELGRIVEIAGALAEALAAAHEKGIVHRDLKPANVMVTPEGRVKVLDFGLAKDLSADSFNDSTMTSAGLTKAGVVMGTPFYMSPEQISGRSLDHRTDIFSLGVMLHEMATGQRPFQGASSAELISSILRDHPQLVTELRPDLPADLARIIRRCLEKDPRRRMQTARDVGNEFREIALPATHTARIAAPASTIIAAADSGSARAAEGFWIAVLPFRCNSADPSVTALAGGLTDEIITGLSRFTYLRVIASGSTARYSGESEDLRAIGRELGARYVLEGSLRQAGVQLRVAVKLIDTSTGANLWAENYTQSYTPERLFDLQDELVPRIVSTVADMHGVLLRAMSELLRNKGEDSLTPREALLRSFRYFFHSVPEEHAAVRRILEHAVQQAPDLADAWAMLAVMYFVEYADDFNLQPNPLDRGFAAAQRAISLAPAHALGHYALAFVHFFRKEWVPFRAAVEQALALNPMDGSVMGLLGILMDHSGDEERGKQMVETAMRLNPNHPGILRFVAFNREFRRGRYAEALEEAVRIKLPGFFYYHAALAAVHGQLGQREAAQKDLHDLLAHRPDFAQDAWREFLKWWTPEAAEPMIDGLRKAGLEIPGAPAAPQLSSSIGVLNVPSGSSRAAEGFWIAVLPFKSSGTVADLKSLAEGISDEIITGLARFPYLRVIAGNSTARFATQTVDVRTVGKELGARYVMEGSIRHSGAKVRIAVQLVDAETGAGLWAETYDRPFAPDAMLDLLDDVVPRMVATVGDTQGILAHNMTEALRKRDPESLTPYEALVRSFGFHQHVNAAEHLECVKVLERAVEQAPDRADCWAMLSWLYRAEHTNSFNPRANSMDRCLAAAQRAVSLAPASYLANAALASAFFFRHELGSFRAAADRALALNNMEGYVTAFLGMHFAYSGDWERGCALAERATQLNPNHPGWYWMPMVTNAYRLHDSERALQLALRINMPGLWTAQVTLVSIYTQLGKMDEARNALRDLLRLRPDFAPVASRELEIFWRPDLAKQMLADLRIAGLDISSGPAASVPQLSSVIGAPHAPSGETRAAEGFWLAVLPFKHTGTNPDIRSLADGLSDEVITGLSRFSYLRVIARGATARHSGESADARAIGNELGARYVMEGSLRQAGTRLRLTVQLADTFSGAQLWAETYERAFTLDAIFELQDDLVPRIVSTVADQYGVLPRSMSLALRSKSADDLTPHEAVLRTFSYFTQITPEEHKAVRDILERAVRHAPNHADAWAMLAMMYRGEFSQGYNAGLNPLDRALVAAQRAVQLSSTHALGHYALATVYFFRKEMVPFRISAEKALALNPLDASVKAYLGLLIASSGEWDRGCRMVESAMQLNPNCPGYYHFAGCWNSYRLGNYTEALEAIARANMPHYYHAPAFHAAVLGQLGRLEEARQAVNELLAVRPEFAHIAREEYSKWLQPDMVEKMLDGLRKAGLEILDKQIPASAVSSTQPIIAVLPFANISAEAEQEYFSDGLTEELINLLAQMPGIKVIARTSSFAFRGTEQNIRKIADALNLTHILEGSVRRSGSRIRVTAQLIAAEDGVHLWSERFDRELSDIFAVQDEIAAAIAKALRVKLSPGSAPQRYTPNLQAYEAYLKGKHHLTQVTPESLELARQSLEHAVELDPNLALAHLALGYYHNSMIHFGRRFARETVPKARAAIQRAIDLDPSLAHGHALLGYLAAMYDYDWAAAAKHFDFPGAKQSSFELVHPAYAAVLYLKGRADEAIDLTQKAIEADPLQVWAHMNLHAYLQAAHRDDDALEQLNKVLELDQNHAVALVSMAMIYAEKGNVPEALEIARRAYTVGPWFPDAIGVLAALLRRSGQGEESESILSRLGTGEALGDAHGRMVFHLLCGEIDAGADWAQKAIEQRDPSTNFYLGFAVCRGLRASHRWPKIAKMLNLPDEA